MEGWKDGRMEGWKDGRMEGRKEGRKDGWMDGWMDGCTDGKFTYLSIYAKVLANMWMIEKDLVHEHVSPG